MLNPMKRKLEEEIIAEKRATLSLLVKELLQLLEFYFKQNWFLLLLEDLPGKRLELHEISGLLSFPEISIHDVQKIQDIINLLDHFVHSIKRYLLPVLREKLRISGLSPEKRLKSKEELLRNGLIASVFPDNLKRLSCISEQIKWYLKDDSKKNLN